MYGRWILLAVLVVLLCGAGVAGAAATWVLRTANSAPALSSLKQRNPGSLTEVFASDGKTRLGFIQSDDLVRPVAANQFPKVLKEATVAIEDERFYKHTGVDYEGIIRAAVKNATSHKTVQGGSTLTMQLVRLLYTQDDTRGGPRRLQAQDPRGQARPRPRGEATRRSGSSASTSTPSPTAPSAASPRSAPAPPRGCTSTSACRT